MKNIILFILILFTPIISPAKIYYRFSHYSTYDGLSENTIRCMIQDHTGMMWFSTWNGLNSFDGCTFKFYSGNIALTNGRIEEIHEDIYGHFWLVSFSGRVLIFDPSKGTFINVIYPQCEKKIVNSIYLLQNGHAWLVTKDGGVVRLTASAQYYYLNPITYYRSAKSFIGGDIKYIFQDSNKNEWLLSDKSLSVVSRGSNRMITAVKNRSFFCYHEFQNAIWFGANAGRIYAYNKIQKRISFLNIPSTADVISITPITKRIITEVTDTKGIYISDYISGHTSHYTIRDKIYSTYIDKNNGIWLNLQEKGCARFNTVTRRTTFYKVKNEINLSSGYTPEFNIHEDVNGFLWIEPYGGGFSLYDWKNDKLIPFHNNPGSNDCYFSNAIHSCMSDRQGNLWMNTHSGGLEKISFIKNYFTLTPESKINYQTLYNDVRTIFKDNQYKLWVCTRNGKINIYDQKHKYLGYLTESGAISFSGKSLRVSVYHITQDRQNRLWIGTRGQGLIEAAPDTKINNKYILKKYTNDYNNKFSLSCNSIYDIKEDRNGNLWIATFGGGLNIILKQYVGKNIFINSNNRLKKYPVTCNDIRCILHDSNGNIWIGTTTGLLICKDRFIKPENIYFKRYYNIPNNHNSLIYNDVFNICQINKNSLAVITIGGFNKIDLLKNGRVYFHSYNKNNGLPSNALIALCKDLKGDIWIASENAICKFNPKTCTFENFDISTRFKNIIFNEATSQLLNNGEILFGTRDGILSFSPNNIRKNLEKPNIVFTTLTLANKEVIPEDNTNILNKGINNTKKLTFKHKQNIFSIEFAAMDYKEPENIKYAYRLLGSENEWIYIGNQHKVTYNNLPKGTYYFQVRSTNSDGIWVNNMRTIKIKILPSFWNSIYAYIMYSIILILIIALSTYLLFTFYKLRNEIVIEKNLSDIKSNLFTNISHELRTPLTLVIVSIENILKRLNLSNELYKQIKAIEKNTNTVMHSMDQVLDSKNYQDVNAMTVTKINIVPFIINIIDSLEPCQIKHRIHLEIDSNEIYLWLDQNQFKKILFDLLSSIFQFQHYNAELKISIKEKDNTVTILIEKYNNSTTDKRITIKNYFKKMANKALHNIINNRINIPAIMTFAEKHNAKITVGNILDKNYNFSICFLKGNKHFGTDVNFIITDNTDTNTTGNNIKDALLNTDFIEDTVANETGKKYILIAEDNDELRFFLRKLFENNFNVITAHNGDEGIIKAKKYIPDIIVSDIMMPRKNGLEVVEELRNDINTCHIPIILLTARSTAENKIEGLNSGADDYITKPFSSDYLKARVNILLKHQLKMREWFRNGTYEQKQNEGLRDHEINPIDEKFMNHLKEFMKNNINNSNLRIDDLAKEMFMSRTALFKKLKNLTGLSPVEYVIEIRLKYAAKLIIQNEYNVSQIASLVGIDNPKYFSKIFKNKYGMSPVKYKESISGKK